MEVGIRGKRQERLKFVILSAAKDLSGEMHGEQQMLNEVKHDKF